jgi:hypothetical protein
MKPNPQDGIAGRAAEERSEDDGMAEQRHERTGQRAPAQRGSGHTGMVGLAMVSCAALAALTFARGAFRRLGAGATAATSPGRLPR